MVIVYKYNEMNYLHFHGGMFMEIATNSYALYIAALNSLKKANAQPELALSLIKDTAPSANAQIAESQPQKVTATEETAQKIDIRV